MTAADVAAVVESLSGPDAWLPLALRRLEQDPLARCLPADERPALARAARAAGDAMARDARRQGWGSAEAALRALGVDLVETDTQARSGPFVHHAVYTAPPPRVTLFREPITALERVLATPPLSARLGGVPAREVILAHELFHHLVQTGGAPATVAPRVDTVRVGRWRRRGVVRAAEEIAAAGFAGAWSGVPCAPDLLDCLTAAACTEGATAPPWP